MKNSQQYHRSILIASCLMLLGIGACKSPNDLDGPSVISGNGGNGNTPINYSLNFGLFNSTNPAYWAGVDTSSSRMFENGLAVSPIAFTGGNIIRIQAPENLKQKIWATLHLHRVYQQPSLSTTAALTHEFGATCFILKDSLKSAKVYVNVAERTLSLWPFPLLGQDMNSVVGIGILFDENAPTQPVVLKNAPMTKLKANFYINSYMFEDNSVDVTEVPTLLAPQDKANINRTAGLTIQFANAIVFTAGQTVGEITLFTGFGTPTNPLSSTPGGARASTGGYELEQMPVGTAGGGKILNKLIKSGATSVTFTADELKTLPAGKCLINITYTSIRLVQNQTIAIAATSIYESSITLQ